MAPSEAPVWGFGPTRSTRGAVKWGTTDMNICIYTYIYIYRERDISSNIDNNDNDNNNTNIDRGPCTR